MDTDLEICDFDSILHQTIWLVKVTTRKHEEFINNTGKTIFQNISHTLDDESINTKARVTKTTDR